MSEAPSRSATPPPGTGKLLDVSGNKPPRFNNGWTREQEELMAGWADISACYRWMHDRCEKISANNNMWITVPVIILSTLTGSANFIMNSVTGNNPEAQKYAQIGVGGVSIFAGILTTLGNFFRYAQNSEANRVASIAWGKFQRQIAVELALHPKERIDSMDFLKICRSELDRLIEQSPPIPDRVIDAFEREFSNLPRLKKPDIAHGVDHTEVFKNNDDRIKQIIVDATMMLKQKKNAWNNMLLPEMDKRIEARIPDLSGGVVGLSDLQKRVLELEAALKANTKLPLSEQTITTTLPEGSVNSQIELINTLTADHTSIVISEPVAASAAAASSPASSAAAAAAVAGSEEEKEVPKVDSVMDGQRSPP